MMEPFNSEKLSFLPSDEHSRGKNKFLTLLLVTFLLLSQLAVFEFDFVPSVNANSGWLTGWKGDNI